MFETLAKLLISWCPERGSNPHAPIKARRSLSIRREIRAPRAHRGEIPDCSANYARICRVSGKKLPHLATLALAALAGCGGGGGDAPAAPPTPPTSAPPTSTCKATVRVQMYGDSTQVAALPLGLPAGRARHALRRGQGRLLILQAVSGTNSQQLIAGTDGLNTPWPGTVDADIAFVNHAINDEGYHHDDLPTFAHDMAVFAQTTKGGVQHGARDAEPHRARGGTRPTRRGRTSRAGPRSMRACRWRTCKPTCWACRDGRKCYRTGFTRRRTCNHASLATSPRLHSNHSLIG
jgi:hypothetical protein